MTVALDRLTANDLMMLWPDDFGCPQDIGALAVLDGRDLLDETGAFRIEAVRMEVERRLHLVPRLRQRLFLPGFGRGLPLWVDDQAFDVAQHVRAIAVPAPAGEQQLLQTVERLRAKRIDRSRPPWELWFLTGLPNDDVGMYFRLHHAVADGMMGVALVGAFLDQPAGQHAPDPPPWTPAPLPSARDLLTDNARRRARGIGRLLGRAVRPAATIRAAREAWAALRETMFRAPAPRTSLTGRIGPDRNLAIMRADLDRARECAHTHSAKVNDVLMTVVASGLRDLLRHRGEPVDDVVLQAFVPVSLHHEDGARAQANRDAAMVVPLPIGEPDPIRRLERIAAATADLKRVHRPAGGALFPNRTVQRLGWRLATHQRTMNLYIANVPGPPTRLSLLGAVVREVFPLVPISTNMTLGVGALSYAGQFNITAVADRDACPDLAVFTAGVRRALRELAADRPELAETRRVANLD